jgi:predicted amidohydrolase
VRVAVAQTMLRGDPRSGVELRESGRELRRLMREAHAQGARLVHFPEGATCSPHKRLMSMEGPARVAPADWGRFDWNALREELDAIAGLARVLGLWTALGAVHRLSPPHRPHNSLYVISDRGRVVTRYDERHLSETKGSYMYTPGSAAVTFQVDGVRFGGSLGIETHFPEVFAEYDRLEVDCVLFSTAGGAGPSDTASLGIEAQGHAATNRCWVSFSACAQHGVLAPSGMIAPDGQWAARCTQGHRSGIVIVDLTTNPEDHARSWRRKERSSRAYERPLVDDPRSLTRNTF